MGALNLEIQAHGLAPAGHLSPECETYWESQETVAVFDCYRHFLDKKMVVMKKGEILYIGYRDNRPPKACKQMMMAILRMYACEEVVS